MSRNFTEVIIIGLLVNNEEVKGNTASHSVEREWNTVLPDGPYDIEYVSNMLSVIKNLFKLDVRHLIVCPFHMCHITEPVTPSPTPAPPLQPSYSRISLRDGPDYLHGVLTAEPAQGTLQTVCSSSFSTDDLAVACRMITGR